MAERTKVVTPPFRVSFPAVWRPESYEGGEPKFGVTAIWEPSKFTDRDKKAWKAMKAALNEACIAKFGKPMDKMGSAFKKGIRNGDEKPDLDGYGDGKLFAAMTSKRQPGLIDRDKEPILSEGDFYGGCYARATITAFAYDNKSKGVAFGLHNIQKLGDGEDFSGRVNAEEDFDDDADDAWAEGDSAGELDDDDPLA